MPSSQISDQARLFSEREASQLSARLREFAASNGVSIYVAAYSLLMGETIDERANRLKEAWLSDRRGIVIVYQRGVEQMTFSSAADAVDYIKRPVLEQLFKSAYAQASQQHRGSSRVIAAADQLMAELPGAIREQQESNAVTVSEARGVAAWALAAILLTAIIGTIGFHVLRRAQARGTATYRFPTVAVPHRFGAPYCGGHQAELEFRVPSS